MIIAVIQVGGAIEPCEADRAFATVVGLMVDTMSTILAGVVTFCAKGYFRFAECPHKSWAAVASIGLDKVDASRVVGASMVDAVVDVALASETFVSGNTVATKMMINTFSIENKNIILKNVKHVLKVMYLNLPSSNTLQVPEFLQGFP